MREQPSTSRYRFALLFFHFRRLYCALVLFDFAGPDYLDDILCFLLRAGKIGEELMGWISYRSL